MIMLLTLMHYKEVDAKKWEDLKKKNETFVTLFFAPWCGHCKAFGPDYQKAGKMLAGVLDFVSVDCTQEQNQELCSQQEVQGYPTVKIFNHNEGKSPKVYEGQRTVDDVSRWARGLQKKPFVQATGHDAEIKSSIPEEGDVLIITTKSAKASSLAFKISKKLAGKATVICHVSFDKDSISSYDDTPFAELLGRHDQAQLVVRHNGKLTVYKGENQGEAIETWISEQFA